MANVKDYIGAVNINADITPTTRQKITAVTPEKWHMMDIEHLWQERLTLNERAILAHQSGHGEVARQVEAGIARIDVLLQLRETEKAELIENPPRPGTLR